MRKQYLAVIMASAVFAAASTEAVAQTPARRVGYNGVQQKCGCGVQRKCGCGVAQKSSCGVAQKSGGCGGRGICGLGIVPAVVQGVGNLIDGLFTCNRCGSSKGCSSKGCSSKGCSSKGCSSKGCSSKGCSSKGCGVAQKCGSPKYRAPSCNCAPLLFSRRLGGCGAPSKCGCGVGGGGGGYQPFSPDDPFIDDQLAPLPVPSTEACLRRSPAPTLSPNPRPNSAARHIRSASRPRRNHTASRNRSEPVRKPTAVSAPRIQDTNVLVVAAIEPVKLQKLDEAKMQLLTPCNPLR
jgi:hypothetical protein